MAEIRVGDAVVMDILAEFRQRHPDVSYVKLKEEPKSAARYVFEMARKGGDSVTYRALDLNGRNVMGILDRLYSSFTW